MFWRCDCQCNQVMRPVAGAAGGWSAGLLWLRPWQPCHSPRLVSSSVRRAQWEWWQWSRTRQQETNYIIQKYFIFSYRLPVTLSLSSEGWRSPIWLTLITISQTLALPTFSCSQTNPTWSRLGYDWFPENVGWLYWQCSLLVRCGNDSGTGLNMYHCITWYWPDSNTVAGSTVAWSLELSLLYTQHSARTKLGEAECLVGHNWVKRRIRDCKSGRLTTLFRLHYYSSADTASSQCKRWRPCHLFSCKSHYQHLQSGGATPTPQHVSSH